jgi:ribonuclease BN (tRNA processing enzyme)
LWRDLPTTIHVPPVEVTGYGPDVLDRLVGPPFFPHGLAAFPMPVTVAALALGSASVGDLALEVRAQAHPGGSLGFRLGDRLAFLTDTPYDPAAADFAAGVEVLVHEAWSKGQGDPDELRRGLAGHTSAEDAARVARDAGAGELLLSHLTPLRGEAYYAEMLVRARGIFPHTHLCADGLARTWDT